MPFVQRDEIGQIIAVFAVPAEGLEEVSGDDPFLEDFLMQGDEEAQQRRNLIESDLGLARVLEDLIDLLIEKGAFRFTDLPDAAQNKLLSRRGLRKEFSYVESLFGTDDEELPEDGDGGGFL
jgi:hypothetical protein